ncbi:MAG: hypothetical protein U0521_06310 [Anaerolineae bacterium]
MLLNLLSRILTRLLPMCLVLCIVVPGLAARPVIPGAAWDGFGFNVCKLPCFAGITPGVTPFDDIYRLLVSNVPLLDRRMIASGSALNFWARLPSQQFGGLIRYDARLVGEMRFNVILPVASVLEELGTPDCILPNTQGDPARMTVIFWERGNVSIGAVLSPNWHTIDLNADSLALWLRVATPGDCSLRGALPWQGFAPLWAYSG